MIPLRTDFQWGEECAYISKTAGKRGKVKEMNFDTATFVRYCEMQRDQAARQGRFDTAQYIDHVIDDLKET